MLGRYTHPYKHQSLVREADLSLFMPHMEPGSILFQRLIEPGADLVLFISKAFPSLRELKKYSQEVKAPFILNFFEGAGYPAWFQDEWKMEDLKEMGVKILDYPFIPLLAAVHAMQAAVTHLARHKSLKGLQSPRMSHEKFAELIGFPQLKALQQKYMPSSDVIMGR